MNDDRLNDDISARHKRELLWSEEDQRLADRAVLEEKVRLLMGQDFNEPEAA